MKIIFIAVTTYQLMVSDLYARYLSHKLGYDVIVISRGLDIKRKNKSKGEHFMARTKIEKNIAWDDVRECYYVTLNYGKGADGKYKKKVTTCSSKKEARAILKEHNRKMEAGLAVPPVKNSFSDYTKDYIEFKSASLEKTTIYGYTNIWKNHIDPYFKKKCIQEISAKDIQDYIGAKAKEDLSLTSIKKHLALM